MTNDPLSIIDLSQKSSPAHSSITLIFTDISYLIDGENQYQDEQPKLEPHIAPPDIRLIQPST